MAEQTERLVGRARERFEVQDYYGVVHLLEEVVASGRAFADVHHLLGVSLSLLGQAERALAEFTRAVELNPHYLEALVHRALTLNELGRSEEAEEWFRRAAASVAPPANGLPAPVASRLANQHAELAEAYAEAGATARAIEQYERALELGPTFHDLRYRMARLLLEANRPLEAREELEQVIRARPSFVDAQAALGL
nr:tetratricopeptide repeat protein [Gemmatimonadales bacterium]